MHKKILQLSLTAIYVCTKQLFYGSIPFGIVSDLLFDLLSRFALRHYFASQEPTQLFVRVCHEDYFEMWFCYQCAWSLTALWCEDSYGVIFKWKLTSHMSCAICIFISVISCDFIGAQISGRKSQYVKTLSDLSIPPTLCCVFSKSLIFLLIFFKYSPNCFLINLINKLMATVSWSYVVSNAHSHQQYFKLHGFLCSITNIDAVCGTGVSWSVCRLSVYSHYMSP